MGKEYLEVEGDLFAVSGNAYSLMGHFKKLARKQKIDRQKVDDVLKEAKNGDYDHLVEVLMSNMA